MSTDGATAILVGMHRGRKEVQQHYDLSQSLPIPIPNQLSYLPFKILFLVRMPQTKEEIEQEL